jgi:hypothetical protein
LETINPNEDPEAITVVLKPDPVETAGVLYRRFLRSRTGIAIMAGGGLCCLAIAGFGLWLIFAREQALLGTFFVVFAGALLVLWPLRIPREMAKLVEKRLTEGRGQVLTFSERGVDVKGPHTQAHLDWEAVKGANTVREGLLLQLGRSTVFISKRNFASDDEYSQALDLVRKMLAARSA